MHMPITVEGKEYLSTQEAIQFLGVSTTTFVKLARDRHLTPYKRGVGKTKYYAKAALAPILEYRPEMGKPEGKQE